MNTTKENIFEGFSDVILKNAGWYELGEKRYNYRIAMLRKPNFIHRFFMRICLGFKWVNVDNSEK
jgi:hypothetical protein